MRRAERLFALVRALQVSDRTICRDIADLVSTGVPIEGEAGVGYTLRRGFDLPLLMFTEPLGLFFWGTGLSGQSWCELREGFRGFRLDRIRDYRLLAGQFDDEPERTLADFFAAIERDHGHRHV